MRDRQTSWTGCSHWLTGPPYLPPYLFSSSSLFRGYTVAKYLEIIKRIRDLLPDAAISTDVIVGFPGETEEQFQNTLKLMEEVKFDLVNTAAYR